MKKIFALVLVSILSIGSMAAMPRIYSPVSGLCKANPDALIASLFVLASIGVLVYFFIQNHAIEKASRMKRVNRHI